MCAQAFGGDANAVTLLGQSAGGNSVVNHLAQPASFHLYSRAMVHSGAYDMGALPFDEAEKSFVGLAKDLKCSNTNATLAVECLAGLDAKTLVARAVTGLPVRKFGPVVDAVSLTDTPAGLISRGVYNNKVPVVIGSVRDEFAFFEILSTPKKLLEAEMDLLINKAGAATVSELKALYAASNYTYPPSLGPYANLTRPLPPLPRRNVAHAHSFACLGAPGHGALSRARGNYLAAQ